MPNTREKLIELLDDALLSVDWDSHDYPDTEKATDILIANGVIVPPVKVGQKLYTIPRSAIRAWTVCGIWISADPKCSYAHVYWEKDGHHMSSRAVNFSDLGRVFFFTREEAEAALQKLKADMQLLEPQKENDYG